MALPIPSNLLPHGAAFPWQGGLVWMHILEDSLLAGGSLLAALTLLLFVLKKKDLLFSWLFYLFSFFFLLVGLTRILGMWEIFHPVEAWDLAIKLPLGILSLTVAVVFFIFLPKVAALPSRVELEKANKELQKEMTERQRAEKILNLRAQKVIDHQNALLKLAKNDFTDLTHALETITETDAKILNVERVSIWFFNEGHSEIICDDLFYCSRQMHEKGLRLKASDYPAYFRSLEESRILAANNAQVDPRTREFSKNYLKPLGISSMMDIPIRLRGKVIGVLCHEHTGPLRNWSSEEQEFTAAISDRISLALEVSERRKAEEKAKRAHEEFVSVVNNIEGIIWEADPNTCQFTFINEQAERLLGYPTERWLEEPNFWRNHIHEEDRDWVMDYCQKATQEKKDHDFDYRMITADGRTLWLRNMVTVYASEGQPIRVRGVMYDITKRKRARDELQKSFSLLQATLESTADGILVVSNSGKIEAYNQKFAEMWRIPEGILQSKDDNAALRFVLDQLQDPQNFLDQVRNIYQKTEDEFFAVLEFKDGRIYERFSIPQQIEGKSVGRVWSFRDVTERQQAQSALEQQRKEQKTIFDSVPAMIYYKDTHNRLLRVNKLGAAAVGRTVEEMEGHFTKEFYPLEAEKFYRDDLEVIQSGKPKLGIVEDYKLFSGEVRWVQSDKIPYRDEQGAVIGVIVFVVDITERKKAEEELKQANLDLQQLSRMKTQFASMVSHELRTPLTVIKEGIGIVLDGIDGPVTEAQRETLDLARDNVDRLGRLINSVLDYEKLESGKMEMNFEETELGELLRHVHQFMKRAAEKRYIQLSVQVPVKPLKAVCDADKLKEVVINLIDNGLKFTSKGGKIVVRLGSEGPDEVKIEVEDNGIGIKKEDQDKIFEMFSQASGSQQLKIGGSGVGLAVCKLIVAQHHGNISVKSALGKGTTFKVCLPIKGD